MSAAGAGDASSPSSAPADEVAGSCGKSGALTEEFLRLARNGTLEKERGDGVSLGEGADLDGEGVKSRGRGQGGVWEGMIGQGRWFRERKPVCYSESDEEEGSARRRRKRKKNRCNKSSGKGEVDGSVMEPKKKRRSSVVGGSDGTGFSVGDLNGTEKKATGKKDEQLCDEEDASSRKRRTKARGTEVKMVSFCLISFSFCDVLLFIVFTCFVHTFLANASSFIFSSKCFLD